MNQEVFEKFAKVFSSRGIKIFCFFLLWLHLHIHSFSQEIKLDSAQLDLENLNPERLNPKRLKWVAGSATGVYLGGMAALSLAWYPNFETTSFHFHNDSKDWLLMDKFGHSTTTYYLGKAGFETLKWTGLSRKKSALYATFSSFVMVSSIEIFDGFSEEWGASPADLVANGLGASLFLGQELLWKEQRLLLKWSYSRSGLASHRPDLLGYSWNERWLKDYNGQTYWLSANFSSFLSPQTKLPKWLGIAVGYGARGMLGSNKNPTEWEGNFLPILPRYQQFYLSPDIHLNRIRTSSKIINTVLNLVGFVKFPLPALEYNTTNAWKFHWLFF